MGVLSLWLIFVCPCFVVALSPPLLGRLTNRLRYAATAVLLCPPVVSQSPSLRYVSRATAHDRMGCLRQTAHWWAAAGVGLSQSLHPSRGNRQSSPHE